MEMFGILIPPLWTSYVHHLGVWRTSVHQSQVAHLYLVPKWQTEMIESKFLVISITCSVWVVERRRKARLQAALGPISIWISSESS